MKNTKTFQGTKEKLKENAGAGLNKVVCVVIVLILIVLGCVGGFFWYKNSKNKELNPLEQSGEKMESGEIGKAGITGGNLSINELVEMGLQVGDYVSYTADIDANADWRVWKIEEDNVIIAPTDPLGNLVLGGAEGWINAEEKIEKECDKYINSSLGITAENIRSMKIEDIEEVLPKEEIEKEKSDNYGKEYSYESGTFYAEKADVDTFDEYNKELNTPKIATSSNPVKLVDTYWKNHEVKTWNKLEITKEATDGETYGTILGYRKGWLTSRCVYCYSDYAYFDVRSVSRYNVSSCTLYDSDGNTYSASFGIRPLVSLSSKLFNGEREEIWGRPWQLGEKMESGEKGEANKVTDENLSINELVEMGLQVGDYVSYTADIDANADWRVWKIEGDNIVIAPTDPLGNLVLGRAEGWINAEEKIEDECDKYINESLGITAENIRSMKIEDIEEVLLEGDVENAKQGHNYGKEYSYESGTFYAEKADVDTFDGYNKELSTPKIASPSNPVKLVDTDWYSDNSTWNKLKNIKEGMTSDTYGTILGDMDGWLASRCVYCRSSYAYFGVRYVYGDGVGSNSLYDSDGYTFSSSGGVRPLVTLSSELFNGAGEGTFSNPWQLEETLENGEKVEMNGVTDESSMELQIGDYVLYTTDINTSVHWRVWKIEGDSVIIAPTKPFGDLTLEGAKDWINAEEKIEKECDKYINSSLGITAEEIRSMKIEDIEEVLPANDMKRSSTYGEEYNCESGTFYAEKADADTDTFDGYNKELSTPKTASSSSPVKLVDTDWYNNNPTWNELKNTKTGMTSDTYGTILGYRKGWLASRCVDCTSSIASFYVRYVCSGSVNYDNLCSSDGSANSGSYGVRPLVTLSSKLFNGEGKGTKSNPWQLEKRIEDGEKEEANRVTDENNYSNDYILKDSDTKLINESDLKNLNLNELNLAYNEIFARHGHDFLNKTLKEYFDEQPWYMPVDGKQVSVAELNDIERQNIEIIRKEVNKRKNSEE